MATAEFVLSAQALSTLHAWLPSDLTEQQLDRVIRAATHMGAEVWNDGGRAATVVGHMRREARDHDSKPAGGAQLTEADLAAFFASHSSEAIRRVIDAGEAVITERFNDGVTS